jgi:6-pyruvoyltetrahydropterin/6-carboxytetrahydropterin synthase
VATVYLTKNYSFHSAHRLHSKKFNKKQNKKIFGKCNNEKGHGHSYILEVKLKGKVNKETGMVLDRKKLDIIIDKIIEKLNYKRIDKHLSFFKKNIPSGENILLYLSKEIKKKLKKESLYSLKLWETRDNYFEIYYLSATSSMAQAQEGGSKWKNS